MQTPVDTEKRRLLFPQEGVISSLPQNQEETQSPVFTKVPQGEEGIVEDIPILKKVADYIRDVTKTARLVRYSVFFDSPFELSEGEVEEVLKELQSLAEYQDITQLKGKKTCYFYSTQTMAHNYAKMLVLLEERDTCNTIAELVRFECKIYPRPYQLEMLRHLPFCYTDSQIKIALDLMKNTPEYQDIQPVYASNGATYLFSTELMEPRYAQALCEWIEVEQFDNP